jgi:hypothetical protein
VPVEQVRQDTAGEHADHAAAREDEAEDPHCLRAVGLLGEQGHQQRERDRGDDCAADTLHRSSADEQLLRVCDAAAEGGGREERDSDQEQPPVAEQVAQSAAEEEEAAKGEQVRVHDPGKRRLREAEIVADRGQCDVHDRAIEDDHQISQAQHIERQPASAAIQCHSAGSFRDLHGLSRR